PKPQRPDTKCFRGEKEVILKPVTDDSQHAYHVSWHYSIIKPIPGDDLISFGRTTIGVEVQAQYDPKRLVVEIDEGEYGVNKIDSHTWRAPNSHALFIERQHIQIRWVATKSNN